VLDTQVDELPATHARRLLCASGSLRQVGRISSRDSPGTSWPAEQLRLPASVLGARVPWQFSLSRPEDGRSTCLSSPHLKIAQRVA